MKERGEQSGEPVVVFEASDAALIPVVESVLTAAGIRFEELGAGLQGLFAGGQLGGFNPVTGPVRFIVDRAEVAETSRTFAAVMNSKSSSCTGSSDPAPAGVLNP